MRKFFIICLLVFGIVQTAFAKQEYAEKVYQKYWCIQNNGITEYKLDDGTRVDCLTDKLAVEFDFAPKWHECIGQALYYGKKTKHIPACVLILEKEDDIRFLYRLKYTVYSRKNIPNFQVFSIKKNDLY